MTALPESYPEKHAHYQEESARGAFTTFERWVYAHELQALLGQLEPTDWIQPNPIGNLVIGREGRGNIGVINLYSTKIEWFDEPDEAIAPNEADPIG